MLKNEMIPNRITVFGIIGIICGGIIIRLFFTDWNLPLNSDNLQYFFYAIDHSLGKTNESFFIHNIGWPYVLSIFFSIFKFDNFMDYMTLQKIISISLSSITAIPIFYLCKKFVSNEYALLGSFVFTFEPRLIQNSTFGISDSLYLIMLSITFFLIFSKRINFHILSFLFLGLSIGIRSESLFILPGLVGIFLIQNKLSKNSILKLILGMFIFSIIIFGINNFKALEDSSDSLFSRIDSGVEEFKSSPETENAGGTIELVISGLINLGRFLLLSQIPLWIWFVPLGLILLVKMKKEFKSILILSFFIILPTIYAYSFSNDVRYLFGLYPIFTVISILFVKKISLKINYKKIFMITISYTVVTGIIFLTFNGVDYENESKILDLIRDFPDEIERVNNFGYETAYLTTIKLEKVDHFPVYSNQVLNQSPEVVGISRINSVDEYLKKVQENELTHLIVKEKNDYSFLDDIYSNEEKYTFLTKVKELSSDEIKLKIFEINYSEIKNFSLIN